MGWARCALGCSHVTAEAAWFPKRGGGSGQASHSAQRPSWQRPARRCTAAGLAESRPGLATTAGSSCAARLAVLITANLCTGCRARDGAESAGGGDMNWTCLAALGGRLLPGRCGGCRPCRWGRRSQQRSGCAPKKRQWAKKHWGLARTRTRTRTPARPGTAILRHCCDRRLPQL